MMNDLYQQLSEAVVSMKAEEVKKLFQHVLEEGYPPEEAIEKEPSGGMNEVGKLFAVKTKFRVRSLILFICIIYKEPYLCISRALMFDNVDFENQLKYISDCGSGDGTLLKQFYNLIREKSLRGRHLDTHPLTLIAIDFNDKALDEARNTLKEYDCIFIKGDIGRHEEILANLKNMGAKSKEEVLHIRSFLDHNRFYTPPRHKARKDDRAYSGVYGDGNGKDITPEKVVQNLVEHLKKWRVDHWQACPDHPGGSLP